ncbi:MAG: response regulator [Planctomycetota bacterium]|jgi:DNA-binding response OmpR family regulator
MAKPRVLVADDDPRILDVLAMRLDAEGYEVLTASTGHRALELARRQCPDVLILDIHMPETDGLVVHDRLHSLAGPWPPVIYLTGDRSIRTELSVKMLGGFAVIYKPFDINRLLETVRRAADRSPFLSPPLRPPRKEPPAR